MVTSSGEWLNQRSQLHEVARKRLKIMRSTRCTKNGIDTNDFSGEFKDFYNFGTDFFFNQKETEQRAMFIDLMKSLLPNYDVSESQLRMKSLKKTQRDTQSDITSERKALKLITMLMLKKCLPILKR